MWRNNFNLLSFTALLWSLGIWFSHWLTVTPKNLSARLCWPFLNNHLKWDNPAGIQVVWNAKNRSCRSWRTLNWHTGNKPTMSVVDSWPPGRQWEQCDSYMKHKISKKLFCFICISRSEDKYLGSSKGNGKDPADTTGTAKKFSRLNLNVNFQKLNPQWRNLYIFFHHICVGTKPGTTHDCIRCYFLSKFVTPECVSGTDHCVHHAEHTMNTPSIMLPSFNHSIKSGMDSSFWESWPWSAAYCNFNCSFLEHLGLGVSFGKSCTLNW